MRLSLAVTTLAGAATVAAPALADGGYYAGALGARAAGRAGAFVARADDPTAISYNPAGLTEIGATTIMVGNRVSHNDYAYTRAPTQDFGASPAGPMVSFPEVRNGKPWQSLEPLLAVASNLGLRDWGFGLGAFAAPGVSRFDFPLGDGHSDGQRYMMLSR